MVSLGQGIVDCVTKEVTEKVTRRVTEEVTKAVTEKLDREFAAKLEKLEQERIAKEREKERVQERDREQLALGLMAEGLSIGKVVELAKIPLNVLQSLIARQAGRSTNGG